LFVAADTYRKEFIPLQYYVDASILAYLTNTPLEKDNAMQKFSLELQGFPYPPYSGALKDVLSFLFGLMLPMFTILGFVFLVPIIHLGIVKEKQSGVKELMRMMGMSRALYWMSWLLSCIISSIVPISIVIIICVAPISKDGAIYGSSDGFIIAIFYILYTLAFICSTFLVTTVFDKRKLLRKYSILE
jgi:hypothetical protein